MLTAGSVLQARYRISKPLGSGGFSTVYLAEDMRLAGRLVAVKENQDTSPAATRAFTQEAELLARLQHAHLPRVTDHFVEPSGYQYLVMDYVEGEDLDSLVKRQGPLDEATALEVMRQVMDAVGYLHSQQPYSIIHRDIKPANLIRRQRDGQIVLVDFGIAKQQIGGGGTLTAAHAATPGYAPPEQYFGRTDQRSDVYALGATLYFLLTGVVPPEAPSRAAGYEALLPPRQINPRISDIAERAILQALELDAGRRFLSVSTVAATLHTATVLSAGGQSAAKSSKSKKKQFVVGGVVGLAVGSALVCALASAGWIGIRALSSQLTPNPTSTPAVVARGTSVAPIVGVTTPVTALSTTTLEPPIATALAGALATETSTAATATSATLFSIATPTDFGLVTATSTPQSIGNGTPILEAFYVSFVADPTSIVAGQSSTLTWTVRGVKAIYLDGEPVSGPTGSQIVKPSVTTTYVLRIIMPDNTIREEAQTVTVTAATPSITPPPPSTSTALPEYMAAFSANPSVTSINGSEGTCRVDNGCTLFLIQVQNQGIRPIKYWVTKEQTAPIGWGAYFCWANDCYFGNNPAPKVLAPGLKENIAFNFRVPSVLVDGDVAEVAVKGYFSCDGCSVPTVYQPYTNDFLVSVILSTATPVSIGP